MSRSSSSRISRQAASQRISARSSRALPACLVLQSCCAITFVDRLSSDRRLRAPKKKPCPYYLYVCPLCSRRSQRSHLFIIAAPTRSARRSSSVWVINIILVNIIIVYRSGGCCIKIKAIEESALTIIDY